MSHSPSLLSPLRGSKSKKGTSALSPYTKVLSPVPSLDGSATAPTRKKLDDGASPKKAWSTIQLPDVSAGSPSGPADGPVTPKDGGVDHETVSKERKAVEFWQQAAEKGHAESMNNLAVSYFHGRGVAKDTNKALKWWTQSADLEYTEAQHNLGVCLFNGRGVEKDHTFAAAMFARAAEKQHPDSTHMLAVCFQNGYGVPKDRAKAIELYKRASDLGVEESEMKIQVLEDRVARESEIEQLENRLGNIKDGFIQLQLERSATEEVTHAYKGAGFFLSNVKSETPIRARIEQAQKAEQEIKHLRTEVIEREKERKALMQGHEGKMHEIEHLHDMVRELQRESEAQRLEIEGLNKAKDALAAENQGQREHIKELLSENVELRTVAEWARNQRVDILKQSLGAVVKSTMNEANEREKKLKHEIEQLRIRLGRNAGGISSEMDAGDHAALFLKQTRRDMFVQEVLVRKLLEGTRNDDFEARVQEVHEMDLEAESMERLAFLSCEKMLDHIDTGCALTDEESSALRESLNRIQGSMAITITETKQMNEHHLAENRRLMGVNEKLKSALKETQAKLEELGVLYEAQKQELSAVEENAAEVENAVRKAQRKSDLLSRQAMQSAEKMENLGKEGKVHPKVLADVRKIFGELHALKKDISETGQKRMSIEEGIDAVHDGFAEFDRMEGEMRVAIEAAEERRLRTAGGTHWADDGTDAPPLSPRFGEGQGGSPARTALTGKSPGRGQTSRERGRQGSRERGAAIGMDSLQIIQEMHDELEARLQGSMKEAMSSAMGTGDEVSESTAALGMQAQVTLVSQNMSRVIEYMGINQVPEGSRAATAAAQRADSSMAFALPSTPEKQPLSDGGAAQRATSPAAGRGRTADGAKSKSPDRSRLGSRGGTPEKPRKVHSLAGDIVSELQRKQEDRLKELEDAIAKRVEELGKRAATPSTMGADDKLRLLRAEYGEKEAHLELRAVKAESMVSEIQARLKLEEGLRKQSEESYTELKDKYDRVEGEIERRSAHEKFLLEQEIKKGQAKIEEILNDKGDLVAEAKIKIKAMEDELDLRKAAIKEAQEAFQSKAVDGLKDVLQSFGPSIAVHLTTALEDSGLFDGMGGGGGGGGGSSQEVITMLEAVTSKVEGSKGKIVEDIGNLEGRLKNMERKIARMAIPGAGGGGAAGAGKLPPAPTKETPLPAGEMDAIKQDIHFAVAAAVRGVLDKTPGGVVLLNVPDHNKPAGFFSGDGAGYLERTVQEQREMNDKLVGDVRAVRDQIAQMEMSLARSSGGAMSPSAKAHDADGVLEEEDPDEEKFSTPQQTPVKAPREGTLPMVALANAGTKEGGVTKQEREQLEFEVAEMREVLQSWYRSFAFVSKLEANLK